MSLAAITVGAIVDARRRHGGKEATRRRRENDALERTGASLGGGGDQS